LAGDTAFLDLPVNAPQRLERRAQASKLGELATSAIFLSELLKGLPEATMRHFVRRIERHGFL
jgi:hypothetical protein